MRANTPPWSMSIDRENFFLVVWPDADRVVITLKWTMMSAAFTINQFCDMLERIAKDKRAAAKVQ